jgi:branched-chain amino acid transport system ATP-binding protein
MLEVDDIHVFYGDSQALWGISLKVEKGELVTIVGPNGAGKSTTLKTISGLLHPTSGTIKFDGKRIEKLPPHNIVEAGIVQIPEGRRLFPYMTVMENLDLGSYPARAKKKDENLEQVFALFPKLKERKSQLAGTLSGGEQQMLAVGRGLMSNPELLMLDEPSLGLAPKVVVSIFDVIKDLHRQGIMILLVEQNVHLALTMCDRAYVMETGRIRLSGEGKSLLDNELVKETYLGA